jgi:hypothetical protein
MLLGFSLFRRAWFNKRSRLGASQPELVFCWQKQWESFTMIRLHSFVIALMLVAVWAIPSSMAQGFVADRKVFFSGCAAVPLYSYKESIDEDAQLEAAGKRTLSSKARDNIEYIFLAWEKYGDGDKQKLAYVLATAFRETSGTFEPIREVPKCGADEKCRETAIANYLAASAAKNGDAQPRENYSALQKNGKRYYGRGFVQLTGYKNYKKAEDQLGIKLVESPELALDPNFASIILVRGMLTGMFTGKRLGDYFDGSGTADSEKRFDARRIVNPGSHRKALTGRHGRDFEACLKMAP